MKKLNIRDSRKWWQKEQKKAAEQKIAVKHDSKQKDSSKTWQQTKKIAVKHDNKQIDSSKTSQQTKR